MLYYILLTYMTSITPRWKGTFYVLYIVSILDNIFTYWTLNLLRKNSSEIQVM